MSCRHYVLFMGLAVLTFFSFSPIAWSWEHPVWPYAISFDLNGTFQADDGKWWIKHLGQDIKASEKTPIRAIGDGLIVYYDKATSYGVLLVVIKHDLGREYTFRNAHNEMIATRTVLSIYGHLRKSLERDGIPLPFKANSSSVTGGTIIGYVNNKEDNGGFFPHLHFGMRLSSNANDPSPYRGYEQDTQFGKDFTYPGEAIQILNHVGRYTDSRSPGSWRGDGSSQAFLNAYNRLNGPVKLGFPFDNGGSLYVHQWPADDELHNVLIQDYENSDSNTRYGSDGQTALLYNRGMNACFLLKEGMWGLYKPPKRGVLIPKYQDYLYGLFGPHDLGAPTANEKKDAAAGDVFQTFDRGELRFSKAQNEWTIAWYNDPPASRKAKQAYHVIPQWEQNAALGFNALASNTLIQSFWAKIGSAFPAQISNPRDAKSLSNQEIVLNWSIESSPPGGLIDIVYSLSGERPFTDAIASKLPAAPSGSFRWTPPSSAANSIWIEIVVKDGEGMIVESQTSLLSLSEPPTSTPLPPTPTWTPTITPKPPTPLPPTPTKTPTPKIIAPISGTVIDISTEKPIANAIISINGGPSTATNPKGEYAFKTLSPGVYDLTVSKTGYQTLTLSNILVLPDQTNQLNIQLTMPGLLNIATVSLPAAEVGVPYNPRVRVTGGTFPYTYTIVSGILPAGLALDSGTGNISGIPTAAGAFTFTVGVRDKLGTLAEQAYTIIATEPLTIQNASVLPRGAKGENYFVSLKISGGIPPYSFLGPEAPPFPESSHAYRNYEYQTWTYSAPNDPNEIRITFDSRTQVESGYDFIYIKDGDGGNIPGSPFTGAQLAGQTVTVPGSKAIITFTSDGSVTGWGFKVTSLSPIHPSGSLPPGFAIDSSGNLTGTPAQTGAFSFTIFVTDSEGRSAEKQFNIEVIEPLTISASILNDGIVGKVYNQKLNASGGQGRLTWEAYSGVLPSGLALDSQSGMILGTPQEETYGTIVLAVSDEEGRIVYKDFILRISPPLAIVRTSLPDGLKGELYSEAIRFQGGIEPYAISIQDGQLPDGLSLDTGKGIVTGTPAAAQLKNFSITVSDNTYPVKQAFTQVLNLRITDQLTITTSAILPNGKKGVEANPVVLAAKGGPSPYRWSLSNGFLPTNMALKEETGELTGTPSAKGDYVFTLKAVDANGKIAQKEFFWHISDDLTITSSVLPDGAKEAAYHFALEAKGGIPPYAWRMKSGALPTGLSFSASGLISGKPAARQTYSFTVEVNDGDSPAQTVQQTYIIQIRDTLFISTRNVPNGRTKEAYSASIRAELGNPPYRWSVESGLLPPGLQLLSTPTIARLEGTPTEQGTYTFTIQVSDNDTPTQTRTFEYTMEVYGKVNIDTMELKSAYPGVPYSANIIAAGGQLPYAWSVAGGTLPTGLHLNPSSGHISGITTLGIGQSAEFTVRVIDSGIPSGFDEKTLVVKVIDGIEIVTFDIPKAMQFFPYEAILEGQGGISPYSWTLLSGRLPEGITLDPITGKLSGEALEFGPFDFAIRMADSSHPAFTFTRAYAWTIVKNPFQDGPETPIEDWMAYN